MALPEAEPLLMVRNLRKHYTVRGGAAVRAVDGVSFAIRPGETLGLVGESGCGKTTTGRCILRLQDPTDGEIHFAGREIASSPARSLRWLRREMQVIFQDPYNSLHPRLTIGQLVAEPLKLLSVASGPQRTERVHELLHAVGLDAHLERRYPRELSGGQRQRVCIARALAVGPRLVVCDEPVSALDVSVQAQVVGLLERLQADMGVAYLFTAHDLAVVRHISHHVGVMYLGKLVEIGLASSVFEAPMHPYTQALLAAVPDIGPGPGAEAVRPALLSGDMPSSLHPPAGCRFHTRCPYATERCRVEEPLLKPVGDGHQVACHLT